MRFHRPEDRAGCTRMADIIQFHDRKRAAPNDLVCAKPFEFRQSDWVCANFTQMPEVPVWKKLQV